MSGRRYPSASIVVPTFNRLADLRRVVAAVLDQAAQLGSPCELVVVDDGSIDGTGEWLEHGLEAGSATIIRQANAGPAVARNRGVAEARGEIVLFLGDDTVPQPGWLLEHLETHRLAARDLAVLGYTSFPAELDSPFLRWINESGAQFGYRLIEDPTSVPFNFFYTSNVSLPRDRFQKLGGFREDFPAAAWEDIEFAYRAQRDGLGLRYNPRARTIHHHRIDLGSFCNRQRSSGRSAAIFSRLHPELAGFLGVGCEGGVGRRTRIERRLLGVAASLAERVPALASDRVYRRLLDGCYLEGLGAALGAQK
ncbi:MAG: glycosyltransferase [Thermoanaerobaculales bacterium]|jgi:GT2 family glycosyltransferase|nr:glycosyltransferase [Thermoanaerobaculales bacterium]